MLPPNKHLKGLVCFSVYSQLKKRATERLSEAFRPGTKANYVCIWRRFINFCLDNNLKLQELVVMDLCVFAEYLLFLELALPSVLNNISALKTCFKLRGLNISIFYEYKWELYIKSLKNSVRHDVVQRPGFTTGDLQHLIMYSMGRLDLLPLDLALSFGYFGFLRGSNLAPQTYASFDRTRHTTPADVLLVKAGIHLKIKWAKNIQSIQNSTMVPLPNLIGSVVNPTSIWLYYLRKTKINPMAGDIPLIVTRNSHNRLLPVTLPRLRALLNIALIECSLKHKNYSLHSLRRGGATFIHEMGIDIEHIKMHGLWFSDAVLSYIQARSAKSSKVVQKFVEYFTKSQ